MKHRQRHVRVHLVFSLTRVLICVALLALLAGGYYCFVRWYPFHDNKPVLPDADDALVWHTVDVGQGDCTIVQFPDDKVLMVDAGSEKHDQASATILQYLQTWQIDTIDWFVITHPDEDHFGGASKLLSNESLTFGTLYRSAFEKNLASYQTLINNYDFTVPADGQVIQGTDAPYTITFVSPFAADTFKESNNSSLMMTIEYYDKIFVLTGDASSTMDDEFMMHATDQHIFADKMDKQIILKVAHHGSSTGSSTAFLDFIFNPTVTANNFALISCGQDNSYGHPDQEALSRLQQYVNAENLLVTKDVGDIVIQATAGSLTINNTAVPTVDYTFYIVQSGLIVAAVVVVVLCFCRFYTKNYGRQ